MKPAVLIVDDDPSVVRMLEMGLAEDYEIVPVFEPTQTINVFSETAIDVVVSDIKMPGLDGYQVCSRIRKELANKEVKILTISGVLNDEAVRKVMKLGADDHLAKPFDNQVLKAKIEKLLVNQKGF